MALGCEALELFGALLQPRLYQQNALAVCAPMSINWGGGGTPKTKILIT